MTNKKLKLAMKWEVKVEGNNRSIQLFDAKGKKLEGHEAYWEGDFYCHDNQLTSLEGAPQNVNGGFYCNNNRLTSLLGAPQTLGGYFCCNNNRLTSLLGAPQTVGGDFDCDRNQLTSLEGAPQTVGGGYFYCDLDNFNNLEIFRYKRFVKKQRRNECR